MGGKKEAGHGPDDTSIYRRYRLHECDFCADCHVLFTCTCNDALDKLLYYSGRRLQYSAAVSADLHGSDPTSLSRSV